MLAQIEESNWPFGLARNRKLLVVERIAYERLEYQERRRGSIHNTILGLFCSMHQAYLFIISIPGRNVKYRKQLTFSTPSRIYNDTSAWSFQPILYKPLLEYEPVMFTNDF